MGRGQSKYTRVYADGYDLSGHASSIGPLAAEFATEDIAGMSWAVKGTLLGQPTISVGTLNAIFSDESTSLHAFSGANAESAFIVTIGDGAEPAKGDPAFCGAFAQKNYQAEPGAVTVTASAEFGPQFADTMNYAKPWGRLLHAKGNKTAVNAGTGYDGGAASSAGGYMVYQIFSVTGGSGTVTISVEDSVDTTDGNFGELLTSGAIAVGSVPCAGIVQLATDATVKRYTRWQIALSTATGVNFAMAFVRG